MHVQNNLTTGTKRNVRRRVLSGVTWRVQTDRGWLDYDPSQIAEFEKVSFVVHLATQHV